MLPLLRFLEGHALNTAVKFGGDVIEIHKNWKEAARARLKEGRKDVLLAGLNRARKYQQTGEGRRRRRRRQPKRKTKTIKRTQRKRKTRVGNLKRLLS